MYNKVISEKMAEAYEAFSMVRHPLPVSAFMNAAPDSRKAATFFTCMAALSAYSTRLRIKYCYDSYLSGCQLHVFIVGDPSTGKGTLDNIQNMLSSKLLERDIAEREKELAYENKRKTKSANQRIEEPPVTCVLVLPPSTSKYKICLRAGNIYQKYADTLFFYMTTAELGTVLDANRAAFSDLRAITRLSYDLDAKYGIDHGGDGFAGIVNINISGLFFGTEHAVDNYFNRAAILDGNLSRAIIVDIPQEIGQDPPMFKPIADNDTAVINTVLEKLINNIFDDENDTLKDTVFMDMDFLIPTIEHFQAVAKREAVRSQSWAMDMLRKRASVSACRVAAICCNLYNISNELLPAAETFSEKEIKDFATAIYTYTAYHTLDTSLQRYGNFADSLKELSKERHQSGRTSIYRAMPKVFTKADLELELEKYEAKAPVRVYIYKWISTGKIRAVGPDKYEKAPFGNPKQQELCIE